ncbi:MAG: MFS transporter [Paludibacteraceae bacterium]|nr:MFS transporter [Paludibacteraceae bacterium]
MEKKQNFMLPIAVMFMLYFMIAFVTNFAGSMGVIVKNQYGVSNALSQLGTLANFIAYACMGVPAGIILKRKGYKFTSLAAVVVGLVGVAIQWVSGPLGSFAVYVCGAFIAGFSMCMLNVVVNPMLNTLGGGGNRGNQLNLLGGTLNSLGGTLAPVLLGYLVGGSIETAKVADAAPAMITAMSIFVVAFIVIFFTDIPEPHKETEERALRLSGKGRKDKHSPLSFRHFVLGAVAIFFYVGVEVGIPNIANLYMSELPEVGPALAGTFVGFYWLMMLAGRLVGGAIGAKVSSRQMLSFVSAVAICFLLLVMFMPSDITIVILDYNIPVNMFFMILCGLCTSVMWGSIFNLAAEGLGKYTPAASGIFMALVCGGGILPFFQGLLADAVGYMLSYIVPIIALAYIFFYATVGSKNVNTDIEV